MPQTVTTQSWGSRIANSIIGFFVGIALIFISIYGIFWNESSGLHTAQSIKQAQNVIITIPTTPIDPNNNLKVVYFSGNATTNDILKDDLLGIALSAIRLKRHVEMYQWKENENQSTENNFGGSQTTTTTYTYEKAWSDRVYDSSQFKEPTGHENPNQMLVPSLTLQATHVNVGDIVLPKILIDKISGTKRVDLANINLATLQQQINKTVSHQNNSIYVGEEPEKPQIGDLRITVFEVLPKTVSVIAQQAGDTLQPYMAPAGKPVALLEVGQISWQQMIHDALVENEINTWIYRLFTLLGLYFAFILIMRPIVILADVIPLFGSIVGFGTGIIALICALTLWGIFTAIAWFAVRPLMAIGLILLIALIVYWLYTKRKASQPSTK